MSEEVTVTVRMSTESRDNMKSVAGLIGVTQFELADVVFGLLTPDMPGLLDKIRELRVKNAEISKQRRAAVRKFSDLTPAQLAKLMAIL